MDVESEEPKADMSATAAVVLGEKDEDLSPPKNEIQLNLREPSDISELDIEQEIPPTEEYVPMIPESDQQIQMSDAAAYSLPVVSVDGNGQDSAVNAVITSTDIDKTEDEKQQDDTPLFHGNEEPAQQAQIDPYPGDYDNPDPIAQSDSAHLVPKHSPGTSKDYSAKSNRDQTAYRVQMSDKNTNPEQEQDGDLGCCGYVLMGFSVFLIILFFPVAICLSVKIVSEYERAVIFRLGRVVKGGAKGPGMFTVIPCTDDFIKVDLRTKAMDIPPQEILSRDSVTVAVDAIMYYRIFDPIMSVCNIENAHHSTSLLGATTLRNVLGTKNMSEILTERETIADTMQQMLDESTDPWGIKVERVEIKDVRLPQQLQRAMAAEAEASREARAKVLAAEGEQNASRALKEAADIIMMSPAALQLRYLQTLNSIAAEKNSTIVFPLPVDLLAGLIKK